LPERPEEAAGSGRTEAGLSAPESTDVGGSFAGALSDAGWSADVFFPGLGRSDGLSVDGTGRCAAISSNEGTTARFGFAPGFCGPVFLDCGGIDSALGADGAGTCRIALHLGHFPRLPAFSSGARKEL
jgi:hypothetical protein